MGKEVWKDIKGYEGIYQVSNKGRVKRLKINVTYYRKGYKCVRGYDEKICKQRFIGNGYFYVQLWKNNKVKLTTVHRLVALTFLPNNENKETVNHKDCNRKNNNLSNLEWATRKEQSVHMVMHKRIKKIKRLYLINQKGKEIYCHSMSHANKIIGRHKEYVRISIIKNRKIKDKEGNEYTYRFVD